MYKAQSFDKRKRLRAYKTLILFKTFVNVLFCNLYRFYFQILFPKAVFS
jgi:hypothetical protein